MINFLHFMGLLLLLIPTLVWREFRQPRGMRGLAPIPAADLKAILDTLSENLEANQRLVTMKLLNQADALLALFEGGVPGVMQGIDLPHLVLVGKQVVIFERRLISGQGEQIKDIVDKLRNKPVLLSIIAKVL